VAAIITVHGTFSNGPEEGPNWWQKGSQFEREVRNWVRSEDGVLIFKPFPWCGANSAKQRLDAGRRLSLEIRDLEAKNERYCLIGHSHAGTILAFAIQSHGRRWRTEDPDFELLSRWITVGSPFIASKFFRGTFPSLNTLDKTAYIVLLLYGLLVMPFVVTTASVPVTIALPACLLPFTLFVAAKRSMEAFPHQNHDESKFGIFLGNLGILGLVTVICFGYNLVHVSWASRGGDLLGDWTNLVFTIVSAVLLVALLRFSVNIIDRIGLSFGRSVRFWRPIYWTIELLNILWFLFLRVIGFVLPLRSRYVGPGLRGGVNYDAASKKWFGLCHRSDEAVAGLRSMGLAEFQIFAKDFAVAPLSWMAILAVPGLIILILYLIASTAVAVGLVGEIGSRESPFFGTASIGVVMELLGKGVRSIASGLPSPVIDVVCLLLTLALIFLVGIALTKMLMHFFLIVSRVASGLMNRITSHQLRQNAFGFDIAGGAATRAVDTPGWRDYMKVSFLPEALADEVSALGDAAAAHFVRKVRRDIPNLALSLQGAAAGEIVSRYLSWDELIHTAYFRVPRFRKLVCFAIAHSPGFQPSDAFRRDADYALVKDWYERIASGAPSPD
jgi:hypothetical protein